MLELSPKSDQKNINVMNDLKGEEKSAESNQIRESFPQSDTVST